MTSTSSSLNGSSLALELADERGAVSVFPLVDAARGEGAIASEGSVADRGRYRAAVLCDADLGPARVTVSVGDDAVQADCVPAANDGPYRRRYDLGVGPARLFADVLGFAVVLVSVEPARAEAICGKTERIACACALSDIRAFAGGMLAQLRSDALAPALEMVSLQGASGGGSRPRSLEALCAMAEEVLGVFAAEAGALKARPRVKTCREGVLERPESVRRLGREEVCWLVEGRSGAAWRARGDGSRELAARRIMCAVPAKSCDNPENRAVLAFVAQAARSMASLERAVAGAVAELLGDRDMIRRAVGAAGSVPTVMLIDEQVADAGLVETRLRDARRGFSRLARGLSRAWGVEPPARFAMPVRSKTFVEVPHYARVWSAMRAWDSFGQVDEVSQAGLWSLRSLSALHELFCLAKLSSWFASHGFELAESSLVRAPGAPPRSDRPEVRNAFVFERAGLVLRLWYQPVFYGDGRDEFGCGAHRTSAARLGGDGVWTPDFAIEARQGGGSRFFVLDAKFSALGRAWRDRLPACVRKYRLQTARDAGAVDAVWALCGKEPAAGCVFDPPSSWAAGRGMFPDGVAALSATADSLDEMMRLLGIPPDPARPASAPRREACPPGPSDAAGNPSPAGGGMQETASARASAAPSAAREPEQVGEVFVFERPEDLPERIYLLLYRLGELGDEGRLTGAAQAASMCGLDRPLCLRKRPAKKERACYTSVPVSLGRGDFYARKEMTASQVRRLEEAVDALEGARAADDPLEDEAARLVAFLAGRRPDLVPSLYDPAWVEANAGLSGPVLVEDGAERASGMCIAADGASRIVRGGWAAAEVEALRGFVGASVGGADGMRIRRARKAAGAADVDAEVVSLISRLVSASSDQAALRSARWSQRVLGLSQPLLRARRPKGRAGRFYTCAPVDVFGEPMYAWRDWRPDRVNRLRRAVERAEAAARA